MITHDPGSGGTEQRASMAIVMPTFNRMLQTLACAEAAYAAVCAMSGAQLVIVDNGSTDGTWEALRARFDSHATLVRAPTVSIAALRNLGASACGTDVVCFVDSDCLVPPDYLHQTLQLLAETKAAAVGAMYALPPDVHWIEGTWARLNCPPRHGPATLLPGGSLSVRMIAFRAVGGFDESFTTGEDADLCDRLRRSGGKIYESADLAVVHLRNVNSIRAFFAKQVWYSMGAIAQTGRLPTDRTTLMSLAHCLLSMVAIVSLFELGPTTSGIGLALGSLVLTPAAAVAYRVLLRGGALVPLPSMLLYSVYFYARAAGIYRALLARTA